MNQRDREAIEYLFSRLARVEQQSGPRDRAADAFIQSQIALQPAAPYYMAQTILAQEDALREAQERIAQLEQELDGPQRGGVLGGMFGGGRSLGQGIRGQEPQPWTGGQGGGFLAGAAQTALGVTGGILLGNLLGDWLSPDEAAAAENDMPVESDPGAGDGGGFGDFDFGDF